MFGLLCSRCHRMGNDGAASARSYLRESTLQPPRHARFDHLAVEGDRRPYRDVQIVTTDGRVIVAASCRTPTSFAGCARHEPARSDQIVEIPKTNIELHVISAMSPCRTACSTPCSARDPRSLAYLEAAATRKPATPAVGCGRISRFRSRVTNDAAKWVFFRFTEFAARIPVAFSI